MLVHQKKETLCANSRPKSYEESYNEKFGTSNKIKKNPSQENKKAYKIQRNLCCRLHKKEHKKYFENLDFREVNENNATPLNMHF